jgi:uncharacterized membrane protein (Fun14 family)
MSESSERDTGARYVWRPWKIGVVAAGILLAAAGGAMALFTGPDEAPSAVVAGGEAVSPEPLDTSIAGGPDGDRLLPGSSPPMPGPTPDSAPTGDEPEVSGSGDTTTPAADAGDGTLSPALLRGGISFLAAFTVGYAFRMFVRIALLFVGIWAISLFALAQAGWLTVHWDEIDVAFRAWASGVGDQFQSFGRFIRGSLPSAGLAGLGLYTGLKRG